LPASLPSVALVPGDGGVEMLEIYMPG